MKSVLPIHGDQHCPGGPDPIPCLGGDPPWARLGGGAGTITNNTWVNVTFNEAMAYNEGTPGDIFTFEDMGDRWRLTLSADGIYLVHGVFTWDDSFAEFRAVDLQQALGDHLYGEGYGMTISKGPFPSSGGPFFNVDWISTFVFKSSSVNTPDPRIDPRAYQSSGVNRGCNGYSVRAIYLGDIGAEASWFYDTT